MLVVVRWWYQATCYSAATTMQRVNDAASLTAASAYVQVVTIPTNRPPMREDLPPRMYFDEAAKLYDVCKMVQECWARGRPVLIGTTSVSESENVRDWLEAFPPQFAGKTGTVRVLNAKPENVRTEAQVRHSCNS